MVQRLMDTCVCVCFCCLKIWGADGRAKDRTEEATAVAHSQVFTQSQTEDRAGPTKAFYVSYVEPALPGSTR